ncbi:MAG: thioredoxin domain-containing protein [Flammeovirgaceae bacterium]
MKYTNRLIHSTSPYLLQHAHNPVDWYEWGNEALTKATAEDKPILLSIGYSSCHWCHVMAHQSFENEDIAHIMNEHFVCIKLDREERPDIDHIYMEAVQAMGQNGGWPLNVFLTPHQKPFFGGTYFPPKNWAQLLIQISKAFKDKREDIEKSANELGSHLNVSELQRFQQAQGTIESSMAERIFAELEKRFDFTWGGIDKAPKFIMPSTWLLLMRYIEMKKSTKATDMLHLTLKRIAQGGIYDQLSGGFARYSVDGEWFAPHFEKMLYDNGQLLSLYAEAYQLTQDAEYKTIVYQTVDWLTREMMHPSGAFYSALDADSEGEEGKFYTWTWEELQQALGDDLDTAAEFYQIEETGNWEHGKNILIRSGASFVDATMADRIHAINQKLFHYRARKPRPGLDDKILLSWNAITICGLTDCYRAFGDETFLTLAKKALLFIEQEMMEGGTLHRSYKNKRSNTTGFLDDYAFLIQAYTQLFQVTFDEHMLHQAEKLTNKTIVEFFDTSEGFFHYTAQSAESLIARKKEIFDNVIPSSNSIMARNLYHLGTMLVNDEWKSMAQQMVNKLSHLIESEPVYMSHWGVLTLEMMNELAEVIIVGDKAVQLRQELHRHYIPFSITVGATGASNLELLKGRAVDTNTIFVCRNQTCQLPVHTVQEALGQIRSE